VTEHTNTLPWQADPNDDYWILGGVTGGKVAEVTFPEDRPLVVRAVNCHTDLVAALENIATMAKASDCNEAAAAALAKAKKR